jgi:hypothetical protein
MLVTIFNQFVGELVSTYSTAAILPWKSIHCSKGNILKASDALTTTRALCPYLNCFFISCTPNSQFVTYPGVQIGHNKTLPEIQEEIQHWLQYVTTISFVSFSIVISIFIFIQLITHL